MLHTIHTMSNLLQNIISKIYFHFSVASFGANTVPAGIYLLKVNNRNTRTRCEICSKLTIKTPERRH